MKQNFFESMTLVSGFMEVPVDRHSGQIGSFLRKGFRGHQFSSEDISQIQYTFLISRSTAAKVVLHYTRNVGTSFRRDFFVFGPSS